MSTDEGPGEMKVESSGGALTSTKDGSADISESTEESSAEEGVESEVSDVEGSSESEGSDVEGSSESEVSDVEGSSESEVVTEPTTEPVVDPGSNASEEPPASNDPEPDEDTAKRGSDKGEQQTTNTAKSRLAAADDGESSATASARSTRSLRAAVADENQTAAAEAESVMSTMSTLSTTSAAESVPVDRQAVVAPFSGVLAPLNVVTGVISSVLSWGLGPMLGSGPSGPVESPLAWALLAWTRQVSEFLSGGRRTTVAASTPTSQTLTGTATGTGTGTGTQTATAAVAAAAANTAPTANPTSGSPNQTTGAVTGNVNGTDAEGNPLSYSMSTAPPGGVLSLNASSGAFTYTPTTAARMRAGSTAGVDFDSFVVSVSDGSAATAVTVNVAVLPAKLVNERTGATGTAPYGVAVVGGRAYVANQGANTVSVINTADGSLAATITVGSAPTAIAVHPTANRVYVTNRTSGTVSVINTTTNTVVDSPIRVGNQPELITINTAAVGAIPAGARLYVANYASNSVSVIDTTTNTIVGSPIAVGTNPRGITFAPATATTPARVYVVNRTAGTISTINPATNTVIGAAVAAGTSPQHIVVSPDGTRAYVTNFGSNNVSVINTVTNTRETNITVGAGPIGIALSPDGAVAYVANGNDTLSLIDTKTKTIISSFQIDTTPETNFHTLTWGADGRLYATDLADKVVRLIAIARGNTPPTATAAPSIGTPNATTGAVTGNLKITDYDGDTLTYTITTNSAKGSLTLTPTGGYTYTPTTAARQQAAQTPGTDTDTFTVRASDASGATLNVTVTPPITPVAGANRPPVASTPTVGTPNQTTGAVSGSLNVTDPDGNPLTYSVSTQPAGGTVTVTGGTYTYTPSAAARLKANTTTGADIDSFAVSVSDGQAAVTVNVNVPVLPSKLANVATGVTGTAPYGVAVVGNRAYVANQGANTVSVINTADGSVVATITVGSAPTAFAVHPNGTRLYVTNRTSGTVSVINTATNTVIGSPITVGSQPELITINTTAISPGIGAGARLYVANYASNSVSVIDTTLATPSVITNITVGTNPRGIAFAQTANGPRVYVVNRTAQTVSVIDAATNAILAGSTPITVGSTPQQVAVSPDGTRAYVTNYGNATVSVINTATNVREANIAVPTTPIGVGFSPDGALAYVANGNDTISVIDTATRTIVTTFQIDSTPETNFHTLTVGANGSLYITDLADRALRIVAFQRGNTAPLPTAAPTVGSPNTTTGAVGGALNVVDYDGDTLTYTVTTSPTGGSVAVSSTAGTYTYTPTAAARQQAAQTPGLDFDTFTVRISDGQATTNVTVTTPITPAGALQSTPWLPFDMPQSQTDRLVFAHYVPWLPVSIDNRPPAEDYYTVNWLNPLGEGGAHAAYGGYLRDRPLPRDPINDPDWRYIDALTEVGQAKSVGIDGFAIDIVHQTGQAATIDALYRAAQTAGNFYIQPTADMSGPLSGMTEAQFAAMFAPYLSSAATQRLSDGRPVLGAFFAEGKSATWWSNSLNILEGTYGLDVAFVPTFLNAYSNMDAFAPFSYGFSSWGGRNPLHTNPTSTVPGSLKSMVDKAHSLGKLWMSPVAFQDNRPRGGIYEESQNSVTNSNTWQVAINEESEWAMLLTWNDYAEMTNMAPSAEHGWRMLDMQAYYIAKFKYGIDSTIARDAIYVSHRSQFANAESTYEETLEMEIRPGTPAPVDMVEVVVFATAPATIYANIGGVVSSCQVGGGRSVCSFPLQTGQVTITMERNGTVRATVQSPYLVEAEPYIQDLQYHVAGGLR